MRADPYNPLSTKPAAGRFERTAAHASWNAIGPALASFALFLLFATFAFGGDDASRSPPIITEGSGRFVVSDVVPPPPPAPPAQDERPILNPRSTPPGLRAPAQPTEPRQKPTSIGNESEGLSRIEIVPVTGQECPVDLSTALRLAEAENPTIALGREAIREALALQLAARGMMLPSLNAGAMYHRHQGALRAAMVRSRRSTCSRSTSAAAAGPSVPTPWRFRRSTFSGTSATPTSPRSSPRKLCRAGVPTRAASRIPCCWMLSDAISISWAPKRRSMRSVARRTISARCCKQRPLSPERDRAALAITIEREPMHCCFTRARNAQESVAVASAELARILHLDPSIRLQADPDSIEPVQLVDPSYRVEELIQIGRNARPEGTARAADISAAEYRLKQEYARPWLPLISVGYSTGGFGGTGSQASPLRQRQRTQRFRRVCRLELPEPGLRQSGHPKGAAVRTG